VVPSTFLFRVFFLLFSFTHVILSFFSTGGS
jgi:hypothetical protein